jgi:hypothetical protein
MGAVMTLEHLLHELHKQAVEAYPDVGFVFVAVEDLVDDNMQEMTLTTNLEDEEIVEVGRQFGEISFLPGVEAGTARRLN